MSRIMSGGTCPAGRSRSRRSTVDNSDDRATQSFGRPVAEAGRKTLPGYAAASNRLVKLATMVVPMAELLNDWDWTNTTGRRLAGPIPCGDPKLYQ